MSEPLTIAFAKHGTAPKGVLIVLTDDALNFGRETQKVLKPVHAQLVRAMEADRFKGKLGNALEIIAPAGLDVARLVVLGVGKTIELKTSDYLRLGGIAAGKIPGGTTAATLVADLPNGRLVAEAAAEMALGARLRSYAFDRYKTRKKEGDADPVKLTLTLTVPDEPAAKRAWAERGPVGEGVLLARELVNEPANVLDPEEFARRAELLTSVGVEVEVLDDAALTRIGMRALLGVAQGSIKESRVVIMRWNGGKAGEAPVAFIGKGVTFDTGGISIKPAAGMEDMKGDMGGAACVTGLMHALAARKAKVNAVGLIGLVENMPDGAAQRPGDIVTSLSGQTIEIINTDAEGRLVLADVLWYAKDRFKPKFMVDLATLTGAIMVALGTEYAGLFSNDDTLSSQLTAAGQATGERVWRMPLGPEYDKLIDSRFADMKNTGGRNGGSITAAQFLQRYVDKTPWAHLDVAGTAMGAAASDINKSWGPGWGVRLLDQLVRDHYEK
ncbi:putative cytosol aminopeptidase [Azorhizobium oxalatiphilum]|uniref:Probable cytosol aminopeptidase n=1 Tax=Azorhizobium oxalatiphilum TaxID=980631 RepID=A0A917FLA1_9HYPH|nr:leucyl aminopeptidase [Azorhizobium oxalatiphilum]GGF87227.1 putative cytosol aminopeptidase [Azorhizobium oxalatiphilum]